LLYLPPHNTNLFETAIFTGFYLDIYTDLYLSLLLKSGISYIKRDINFNVPEEYNYESHQSCLSYFAGLPLALNYGVLHHFKLGINIEPRIDIMEIDRYFSISYGILLGIEY